ncbi:YdcF family protein [Saccharopolyspora sp. NFXS83]|uniref:YdcF family protein n=1 Tax=Saccharopolyspora sp. NFXS83 TaxID=2993560 RepID=UPI00224B4C46|nr:YdcF family protein [Saccharopolyspora sp. NFXS83]MCX2731584.1 YdcF family protein [Saccharopolyspora sp. NFXS83]
MSEVGSAHRGSRSGRVLRRTALGAVLMVLLLLGGTGFRVWQVARTDDRRPVDMIVVLGAAQYHGKPTPVLRARLEQALELYEQGLAEHVVTVGGSQEGDEYTEAEAGKLWLAKHGVPESKISIEPTGSDTLGSLRAVGAMAKQNNWNSALIVSDPWHSLRARTMAGDFGLDAWASPTRSGPMVQTRSTQLHYIIRETGGLLFYRLTHAPAEVVGDGLG